MRTSRPHPLSLVPILLLLSLFGQARSQAPLDFPVVAWRPAIPLQGSLVLLGVRMEDTTTVVDGELADEPLHFERIGSWYRAVGGVPASARDSVRGRVIIARRGRHDTVSLSLPVARRRVRQERLRTAPRFVKPPDSLLPRIRAERVLVQRLKRQGHEVPRLWQAPFLRPRAGAITSPFGRERVFNGTLESRHLGVDFGGTTGDPVRATNRGIVTYAGALYYSGNTIFLDHGGGLVTAYLHLSRFLVSVGDTVDRGQIIGRVGATGRVTGPHLHWLAAYGSVTVDPLDLLTLDMDAQLVGQER
jgi:murein DD-endopeptidase MepM/ murein hydrolase activator NlpD